MGETSKIFTGTIKRVYIHQNNGYSIGEIYSGIKAGSPVPVGIHVHGGNGTYIDYGNAEYVPTDHKVMVRVKVECPYTENKVKKVAIKKLNLEVCSLSTKLTSKRQTIYEYVSGMLTSLDITVEHVKDADNNKNIWRIPDVNRKAVIDAMDLIIKGLESFTEVDIIYLIESGDAEKRRNKILKELSKLNNK